MDWDKKLSDVRTRTSFLPGNQGEDNVLQRRYDVEKIRQLAMGTPAAVARLLRKLGCCCCCSEQLPAQRVRVIVKEGTRPLTQGWFFVLALHLFYAAA